MADITTTTKSSFSDTVDQRDLLSPLGSPTAPISYLDRFSDDLYDKSPDSHLVRFLYTVLGPAGIGWLKKDLLDLRLALATQSVQGFELEKYYGSPFAFGRILTENIEPDLSGLLDNAEEAILRAQDASYRNRALDFMAGAHLGNSPEGMHLVARSGLGYEVEVIENYKALFDAHSDSPKGYTYFGKTTSLHEFIVVPRKEQSTSEVQVLNFEDSTITNGTFVLAFRDQQTPPLAWDCDYIDVQTALQNLGAIGQDNVEVFGGPSPNPFNIYFKGALADQDVPQLTVISALVDTNSEPKTIVITTEAAGRDASQEEMTFSDAQMHSMQTALDRIRPVATLPTFATAPSHRTAASPPQIAASSNQFSVLRYVTGKRNVRWPKPDKIHWIEQGTENEAPKAMGDIDHHYVGWHNPNVIRAYKQEAEDNLDYNTDLGILETYKSEHIGRFPPEQRQAIPYLNQFTDPTQVFLGDKAQADYPEQPLVTSQVDNVSMINGIYPMDYTLLPGVTGLKYQGDQFWASLARSTGSEVLEINLNGAEAINLLSFDSIQQPIRFTIHYDVLDQSPRRHFAPVSQIDHLPFQDQQNFSLPNASPWETLQFHFRDAYGDPIFASTIRITITRMSSSTITPPPGPPPPIPGPPVPDGNYLWDPVKKVQNRWSVFVRNLRIGRVA